MNMEMTDLERFIAAQEGGCPGCGTYAEALEEMRNGQKQTHWIWYVLPQLRGLGRSEYARFFGLADLAEARAYLAHPVLGARLRETAEALLGLETDDPQRVMNGHTDARKLRSSMTLFDMASPEDVFGRVLEKYFGGSRDENTLALTAEGQM